MRQTAARLNRTWLTLMGILLLLAGLAMIVIGTGLLQTLARSAGYSVDRPAPTNRLFGSATASAFGLTWAIVLMAVVGIVLALLGVGWLVAQIPRSNEAKAFRLHDSAADGLTRCSPHVLTDAVENQIKSLPGVSGASAVLRGTAQEPDLTVRVTANDRTDIPQLLNILQTRVADDVGGALDTQLGRLGVQLEVGTTKSKTNQIILQ